MLHRALVTMAGHSWQSPHSDGISEYAVLVVADSGGQGGPPDWWLGMGDNIPSQQKLAYLIKDKNCTDSLAQSKQWKIDKKSRMTKIYTHTYIIPCQTKILLPSLILIKFCKLVGSP
jgi:hypothetical protein